MGNPKINIQFHDTPKFAIEPAFWGILWQIEVQSRIWISHFEWFIIFYFSRMINFAVEVGHKYSVSDYWQLLNLKNWQPCLYFILKPNACDKHWVFFLISRIIRFIKALLNFTILFSNLFQVHIILNFLFYTNFFQSKNMKKIVINYVYLAMKFPNWKKWMKCLQRINQFLFG